jgi:hypothetical protein
MVSTLYNEETDSFLPGGAGIWTTLGGAKNFRDPNRAVRAALKPVRKAVENLKHIAQLAEGVLD